MVDAEGQVAGSVEGTCLDERELSAWWWRADGAAEGFIELTGEDSADGRTCDGAVNRHSMAACSGELSFSIPSLELGDDQLDEVGIPFALTE